MCRVCRGKAGAVSSVCRCPGPRFLRTSNAGKFAHLPVQLRRDPRYSKSGERVAATTPAILAARGSPNSPSKKPRQLTPTIGLLCAVLAPSKAPKSANFCKFWHPMQAGEPQPVCRLPESGNSSGRLPVWSASASLSRAKPRERRLVPASFPQTLFRVPLDNDTHSCNHSHVPHVRMVT